MWIALEKSFQIKLVLNFLLHGFFLSALFYELLVVCIDMLLPEPEKHIEFVTSSIQIDSHPSVVLSSEEVSETLNDLCRTVRCSCVVNQFFDSLFLVIFYVFIASYAAFVVLSIV